MPAASILIVEDESITALDIERSLKQSGYKVAGTAGSGEEAITLAEQRKPDLILMDIRLKGQIDGIQAAEEIRSSLNVPIIFLTAYADRQTLQRSKKAEPFAYLLKPFEDAVLSTTIEIALHKHNAHELLVRETTEALRLSQDRFDQLAFNMADYSIILLDLIGNIQSWNPGAERLHGWAAEDTLGKNLALLFPKSPSVPFEQQLHKARLGKLSEYCTLTRSDASSLEAQILLIALKDSKGQVSGFLLIAREVTGAKNHN